MRLKELREERGFTQTDVANGIKTNQRGVSRWENGENQPPADMIVKLADFFEVSADYLLGRSDDFGNVTVQTDAPYLSADERELLACYRELTSSFRELALTTVRTWTGSDTANANKRA